MKKVSIQFTDKKALLFFLQTVDPQPCVVDLANLSLVCEVTDDQLAEVNDRYRATYRLLPALKKRRIR